MNLSAIQPKKTTAEERQAADIAQRNRSIGTGSLAFKNTGPVLEVLKGAAAPVNPGAPTKPAAAPTVADMTTVLKTMADGFTKLAAALKGPAPVQKAAAPAPSPAPAPTSVAFNTPLATVEKRARTAEIAAERTQKAPQGMPRSGIDTMLPKTATQLTREAEERAQARKAAQKVADDRELVTKSTARILTFKALDVSLSDNALLVLNHVVTAWEKNGRRPVPLSFSAVADAVELSVKAVRTAVGELGDKRALISAADSAGVTRYQPGLGITGERQ